jgi:cytochrome c oxidase subunit 2
MGVAVQVLQSVLDAAGPQSASIARLWWLMLWVTAAVFIIVLGWAAFALRRGMRQQADDPSAPAGHSDLARSSDAAHRPVVMIAVAVTVATLFVLLGASVWTNRAVASLGAASAVTIELTGHQWWWEVVYESGAPNEQFRTANEIHIPVGRPVALKVTSADVIHSIWIPNLQGKRDLIPGYTTAIWLQADRPGVYRGQCAEFCGMQHAHMALFVTAESNDRFERWRADQIKPAAEPLSEEARTGRDVFLHATCGQCHTIRGTIAGATMGPDLTHLATRGSLGSGTLPNTRGHLGGWLSDSQQIKPGNHMPPNSLRGDDLQALLTYLEGLR